MLEQEGLADSSCERGCTRDDYGQASPFSVERLKMGLPFVNVLCVHSEVPALFGSTRQTDLVVASAPSMVSLVQTETQQLCPILRPAGCLCENRTTTLGACLHTGALRLFYHHHHSSVTILMLRLWNGGDLKTILYSISASLLNRGRAAPPSDGNAGRSGTRAGRQARTQSWSLAGDNPQDRDEQSQM